MKTKSNINPLMTGLAFLLAIMLLSGCRCNRNNLLNHEWSLVKYGPKDSPTDILSPSEIIPPARTKIILQFKEDNSFNGNDGCNNIFGKYKVRCICKIEFDSIRTTLMMCQENIMIQAGKIRELLTKTKKYKVSETNLKLYTPDGKVLIYTKD